MTDTHPELTLSDVTWLTALARSLTRDGAEADDLVQETWIAASASPPADGAVNRAWLARVLRNFHLKSLRSQDRRSRREQVASRAESQPSSADLVEAAELRRNLADGLLALAEPYRTTLMRVAFEGQTARQISEVEGVSVGVVRHRLRKARELYKQELDRRCEGEGSRWYAALLPFADLPLPGEVQAAGVAGGITAVAAVGGLLVSIKTLLAVGAAALASLIVWLMQDPGSDSLAVPEALDTEVAVVALETPLEPREEAPAREQAPSGEAPAPSSFVEESADAAPQEQTWVRVSGKVIYRDEFGALLPTVSSGGVTFDLGGMNVSPFCHVVDGSFSRQIPKGSQLKLHRNATLGKRAAEMLDYADTFGPFNEDTEITLEARRLPAIPIEVVDEATGEHVHDIQIVSRMPMSLYPMRTSLERPLIKDGVSPVELTLVNVAEPSFFVSAPGYPWTVLRVDPYSNGNRRLALRRGSCDLQVQLAGLEQDPCEVTLSSLRNHDRSYFLNIGADEGLRLERLAPGDYELEAVAGELKGRIQVHVEPGEQTVTLPLEVPESDSTLLYGTLALPESWSLPGFTLELRSFESKVILASDQLGRDEENPDLWRIPEIEVLRGSYFTARIEQIGWFRRFRAEGAELWLEVPPPVQVRLTVMDGITGLPIDPSTEELRVSWAALDNGARTRDRALRYDEETQGWPFRAPMGGTGVYARSPQLDGELKLDLANGSREVELWVYPTGQLVIDLYDGETRVPPPDDSWTYEVQLEAADGSPARISDYLRLEDEVALRIARAGVYTLKVRSVTGFAPIPDAQIEITAGELLRHRIDLERK